MHALVTTAVRPGRMLFWAALPAYGALAALGLFTYRAHERQPLSDVYWLITALTVALWAALSMLALWRRAADRRVRLFAVTAVAVSLTLVMPTVSLNWPAWLVAAGLLASAVIYFGNVPVVVHMVSEIPGANPFIARHPSFIRANYLAGAVLVVLSTAAWSTVAFGPRDLPGLLFVDTAILTANRVFYVYAGAAGIWLLVTAARAERLAHRRRQAFLVLTAMAVWTLDILVVLIVPALGESTAFTQVIEPLGVMIPPLAIAVAVFGFRLLDIGGILRKGFVYGVSIGGLLVAAYLAVDLSAAAAAELTGVSAGPGVTIAALAAVAFFFEPISRRLSSGVDRVFFPEKRALRRMQRTLLADMTGETSIDALGQMLVRRLVDELETSSAVLLLAGDERALFRVRAMAGDVPGGARTLDIVARPGAPLPPELPCETMVSVDFGGDPLALICLGPLRSGARLDADDRDALTHIAQQLSAMLENARLFELARTDSLTGLARRHVFDERLRQEMARSSRTGRPFSVALIDVDHFKRINDAHGHGAGDKVLQRVAQVLLDHCRSLDLVARYGGEEFVVLLPETDAASACRAAEKLRTAVEGAQFDAGSQHIRVSVSIGTASASGTPDDDVVARADEALYAAKRAGRNQVR